MKNIIKKYTIFACIMILPLLSVQITAQPLPPLNGHNQNGNQPAGAPLDGGLSLLVLLGAAYGSRKIHRFQKEENKKQE